MNKPNIPETATARLLEVLADYFSLHNRYLDDATEQQILQHIQDLLQQAQILDDLPAGEDENDDGSRYSSTP